MQTTAELLEKMVEEGGCLILASACSTEETNAARQRGDYAINHMGIGFVRRTNAWLDRQTILQTR